jgi:hypothetical protein
MSYFSLRMQGAGVSSQPGVMRGYIRPQASGRLLMQVAAPVGSNARRDVAFADGQRVRATVQNGLVTFELPAHAGRPADWSVVAPPPSGRGPPRRSDGTRPSPRARA